MSVATDFRITTCSPQAEKKDGKSQSWVVPGLPVVLLRCSVGINVRGMQLEGRVCACAREWVREREQPQGLWLSWHLLMSPPTTSLSLDLCNGDCLLTHPRPAFSDFWLPAFLSVHQDTKPRTYLGEGGHLVLWAFENLNSISVHCSSISAVNLQACLQCRECILYR